LNATIGKQLENKTIMNFVPFCERQTMQ